MEELLVILGICLCITILYILVNIALAAIGKVILKRKGKTLEGLEYEHTPEEYTPKKTKFQQRLDEAMKKQKKYESN